MEERKKKEKRIAEDWEQSLSSEVITFSALRTTGPRAGACCSGLVRAGLSGLSARKMLTLLAPGEPSAGSPCQSRGPRPRQCQGGRAGRGRRGRRGRAAARRGPERASLRHRSLREPVQLRGIPGAAPVPRARVSAHNKLRMSARGLTDARPRPHGAPGLPCHRASGVCAGSLF